MKVTFSPTFAEREKSDITVLPYWEKGLAASDAVMQPDVAAPLFACRDFKGEKGEVVLLYASSSSKEPRVLLLGLGEKNGVTAEILRIAYAQAVKAAQGKGVKKIHFSLPAQAGSLATEEICVAALEGVLLANYQFIQYKGVQREFEKFALLEHIAFSGIPSVDKSVIDRVRKMVAQVHYVRDLVNANADEISPERLEQEALASQGLHVTILRKKELEKEGLGLLLAVGRAATQEPRLICVEYRGNPKAQETIVLVGKGVTYDTGGLCLKGPEHMLGMKADMAGAATVLGAIRAAAGLDLKVNVVALMPVAENAIGPGSYKQGDVYRSCNGKTVEILNTDAEGRLLLADALAYAVKKYKPSCMVDIGTLTGGIILALGEDISGLFASDDQVASQLLAASARTGENLWRMPLYDYKETLRSDIADLANMGGREAGSMKCALFLQEFTENIPWAHIDMAGPAYLPKPKQYNPTKGTGWGVRLLTEFLESKK